MMEWLIAHNLGIIVIIVPMVLLSVAVIKVEYIIGDIIKKIKR